MTIRVVTTVVPWWSTPFGPRLRVAARMMKMLRKLALGGELKLVRKPPKVSRGYAGVARTAAVHGNSGSPETHKLNSGPPNM